eukprot:CAMPEP_0173250210 /NCGR_PEP_ID=MMETSP1142-20121109/19458_1 /TAXON_ID=483371 /ORGANISM="non described non described, Strain CCMP2298" /LENGTH=431 /DNA_ID=CAMNT_0014182943 /DNA_START=88 /DNA_END=1379 /DNA_ORIENTATION=-
MESSSSRRHKKQSAPWTNIATLVCLLLPISLFAFFALHKLDTYETLSRSTKTFKTTTTTKNFEQISGKGAEQSTSKLEQPQPPLGTHVVPATPEPVPPLKPGQKVPNPAQQSPNAYVTLISGIDKKFRYRGFLYNALIMKKALHELGSSADFVAMIGYSDNDTAPFQADMDLLRSKGIITYELPRLLDWRHKLGFAEMALLKITPYSFTQYQKIQFFDGDVMPTHNMDCFFQLQRNTFTIGAVSPLNSGWYLALPDAAAFAEMRRKAVWRLERDWDTVQGWAEKMPKGLTYRGGRPCVKWLFNGADMDQGLFAHYFVINHGNAMMIDTDLREARVYAKGLLHEKDKDEPMKNALKCCNGLIPTYHYAHFTGRSKPWLQEDLVHLKAKRGNANLLTWRKHLDGLGLDVNSSTISKLKLVPPLGYFNSNFPKG